MQVGGADIIVEGEGREPIVFVHGWPDTYRLWDAQVEALKGDYQCVRFTLPGFEATGPRTAHGLDDVVEHLRGIVEQVCPGRSVTLALHDWGCVYGYQFAARHPHLVRRVIGVDVGDAGSRHHLAALGAAARLLVLGYQWWLAAAWRIGGPVGDRMARWLARLVRAPAHPDEVSSRMGYPYAVLWFGAAGGFGKLRPFKPLVPMLFLYGERKPFMFHSPAWAAGIAARPHCRVIGCATGHWVMAERPGEFNATVMTWLAESAAA